MANSINDVRPAVTNHRWSQSRKAANDNQWYKDRIDDIIARGFTNLTDYSGLTMSKKLRRNYDLYNGIINPTDFEHISRPYGQVQNVGELPATFVNRDIVSPKIKALEGMEIKRPFGWKVVAVNEEATTRKEQEEFGRINEFLISQIMNPIRIQIEQQYQQQQQGRELTTEEQAQIQQQISQETEAQTPEEVRKYMERKHQDPAEVLMHQLMTYLMKDLGIKRKFTKGFKHLNLSAGAFFRAYIKPDGNPAFDVINPRYFDYERNPEVDFVEDCEWAVYKKRMSLSQVVAEFPELREDQIDELYNIYPGTVPEAGAIMAPAQLDHSDWSFTGEAEEAHVPVYHVEFKSLVKIGWLTYIDEEGEEQMKPVSEDYKLNEDIGDIDIDWEYIPQLCEGYKIGQDMFLRVGPVQGQHTDLDKIRECKLTYTGGTFDDLNSVPTSTMDRAAPFQFFYDIINFRVEMLLASDKGKKLLMNLQTIPKSLGIDLKTWMYYLDASGIAWYNPKEEGNRNDSNAGTVAKEIDLSMASQINNYIQLLDYIETRCGAAIGVPKAVEGQIGPNEAVTNVKQTVIQTSHILEPMFEFFNIIKGNALTALLNTAKTAYTRMKPKKLSFVLDDMSLQLLDIDSELLDMSSYGLYLANNSKANEVKQAIDQYAHAAMQNDAILFSDLIKVLNSDGVQESEELMRTSEENKQRINQQQAMAVEEAKAAEAEKARAFEREKWGREDARMVRQEQLKTERELQKQTILSLGFSEDKDIDNDGTPDIMEVYKEGTKAKIAADKNAVEMAKLNQKATDDKEKNEIAKQKIAVDKIKANKPSSSK